MLKLLLLNSFNRLLVSAASSFTENVTKNLLGMYFIILFTGCPGSGLFSSASGSTLNLNIIPLSIIFLLTNFEKQGLLSIFI